MQPFGDLMNQDSVFDDSEAAFGAAGVDMAQDEPVAEPEMSREEQIFTHLVDELIQHKQDSLAYQQGTYDENTAALQEADKVRRKLGG